MIEKTDEIVYQENLWEKHQNMKNAFDFIKRTSKDIFDFYEKLNSERYKSKKTELRNSMPAFLNFIVGKIDPLNRGKKDQEF